MKKLFIYLLTGMLSTVSISCSNDFNDIKYEENTSYLDRFRNKVVIDSAYTYVGDSIYHSWLNIYNSTIDNRDTLS